MNKLKSHTRNQRRMYRIHKQEEKIHNLELLIGFLQQENQELQKQLEYLRSGEYLNQLRFERNMLQDVVDKMEVSNEDKMFINMTCRNTELLEENRKYKEAIDKAIEYINLIVLGEALNGEPVLFKEEAEGQYLLGILKEVE